MFLKSLTKYGKYLIKNYSNNKNCTIKNNSITVFSDELSNSKLIHKQLIL